MNRWRRVGLLAAAAAALALVVAACGGASSGGGASGSNGGSGSKGAVAMSFGGSTIALWDDELALMRPIIQKAGYKFLTDDPQFQPANQVQDWQSWIAEGNVKAIMGWPIQVNALEPVTKQASQANIAVIGYAVTWPGVKAALLTTPLADGKRMAGYAVAWIKKHYGDQPVSVAVLTNYQNDLTRYRVDGLIDGVTSGDPHAIVYKVSALTLNDGYTAAKAELSAHPNIRVWLSYSNDNMKGVYKALMDKGVSKTDPHYFLAGMDVTNEDLNLIRIPQSIYRMAFAYPARTLADQNAKMLIEAAQGKKVNNYFLSPSVITAANAKDFYVGKVNH